MARDRRRILQGLLVFLCRSQIAGTGTGALFFFFSPSPRVGLVAIKNIKMPGDEIYRFMPAILKFTKEYKRVCSRAVWGNFANPFQDLRCLCEQGNGGISHGSISKAQKFSVKGFGRSTWD